MMYQDIYDIIHKTYDYPLDVDFLISKKDATIEDPSTLLEIGCGTGKHTALLANHFKHIYAIDNDPKMIERTKKILLDHSISHVSCYYHDATDLNSLALPPCSMGCAFFNVVNYLLTAEQLEGFFQAVSSSLQPNAFFIFDCLDDCVPYQSSHRQEFTYPYTKGTLHRIIDSTYNPDKRILNVHEKYQTLENKDNGEWKAMYKLWSNKQLVKAAENSGLKIREHSKKHYLNPDYKKKNQILYILQKGEPCQKKH